VHYAFYLLNNMMAEGAVVFARVCGFWRRKSLQRL